MSKKEKFFRSFAMVFVSFFFFSLIAEKNNGLANQTATKLKIKPLVLIGKISETPTQKNAEDDFLADDFWLSKIKINWEKIDWEKKLESAPTEEIEVVSSAYYRPLKKQKRFSQGSYRREIRLNGEGFTTSSRVRPKIGTIAADLDIFPLGTIMEIGDYGLGIVQDTGKNIQGHRIDLFMGEGQAALDRAIDWGKKTIQVKVLGKLSLG